MREVYDILTHPSKLCRFTFNDAQAALNEMVNLLLDASKGLGYGPRNGQESNNLEIIRATQNRLIREGMF